MSIAGVDFVGGYRDLNGVSPELGLIDAIDRYSHGWLNRWGALNSQFSGSLRNIDSESAALVAAQVGFNQMNLEVQLMTKVADGFSSSIRRLQQGS